MAGTSTVSPGLSFSVVSLLFKSKRKPEKLYVLHSAKTFRVEYLAKLLFIIFYLQPVVSLSVFTGLQTEGFSKMFSYPALLRLKWSSRIFKITEIKCSTKFQTKIALKISLLPCVGHGCVLTLGSLPSRGRARGEETAAWRAAGSELPGRRLSFGDRPPPRPLVAQPSLPAAADVGAGGATVLAGSALPAVVLRPLAEDAVVLFFAMADDRGVSIDAVAAATAFFACAQIRDLALGREAHHRFADRKVAMDVVAWNALVDMRMPVEMNVVSWNTMISASARAGELDEALALFQEMQAASMRPDDATFVAVLGACAQLGALDTGIEPYGCVVDMLARSGRLDEAVELVAAMPMQPDTLIWGSLLAACRAHGDVGAGDATAHGRRRRGRWRLRAHVERVRVQGPARRGRASEEANEKKRHRQGPRLQPHRDRRRRSRIQSNPSKFHR
uniref:Pentacotripeptide-repeat region of PRORP domain-containing protein n=1 Tax=Oryza brachyantha TaxID=4533 RepID=J3LQB1_ORYBR